MASATIDGDVGPIARTVTSVDSAVVVWEHRRLYGPFGWHNPIAFPRWVDRHGYPSLKSSGRPTTRAYRRALRGEEQPGAQVGVGMSQRRTCTHMRVVLSSMLPRRAAHLPVSLHHLPCYPSSPLNNFYDLCLAVGLVHLGGREYG